MTTKTSTKKTSKNSTLPTKKAILDPLIPSSQKSDDQKDDGQGGKGRGGLIYIEPRGDPFTDPIDPFGGYGRSDLYPNTNNNPFNPNSGGNLLGPTNPLFIGKGNVNPNIRFDPVGPGTLDPTDPDNDLFLPKDPSKQKSPFGGPLGGDPFGGGFGKKNPFGGGGGFGGGGFGGGGGFF